MKCKICGAIEFTIIFRQKNYSVQRCRNCGFGILNPLPSKRDLDLIYNDLDYHQDKSETEHITDAQKKLTGISRWFNKTAKLLDYGCGPGTFLMAAKNSGFTSFGYDISSNSAAIATRYSHCDVKSGLPSIRLFDQETFDIISAFDVIEHIIDFDTIFSYWSKWLKPKGYLFITTPDLSSWDYHLLQKRWYGFTKIPQHINYFDRNSIKLALEKANFEIVEIKTWGFSRQLQFVFERLYGKQLFIPLLKRLNLDLKTVYLPMIDMMIVAKKKT